MRCTNPRTHSLTSKQWLIDSRACRWPAASLCGSRSTPARSSLRRCWCAEAAAWAGAAGTCWCGSTTFYSVERLYAAAVLTSPSALDTTPSPLSRLRASSISQSWQFIPMTCMVMFHAESSAVVFLSLLCFRLGIVLCVHCIFVPVYTLCIFNK